MSIGVAAAVVLGVCAGAIGQTPTGVQEAGPSTPSGEPAKQPETPPTAAQIPAAPQGSKISFSIEPRAELDFNASFKDAPGDVTITRAGVALGARMAAGDRGQVNLGLDYEFSNYAFSNATGLVPGVSEPWSDVHRVQFSGRYSRQQTREFSWFVGGGIGAAGEDGADWSQAIYGAAFAGGQYALSEKLTLGLGVAVRTLLEDNPQVYPIPIVNWQISDQWKLTSGGRPGVALSYSPTEQLTFRLSGGYEIYELRDFRLAHNGPVPDGVGRETRIPVMLGVTYAAGTQISLEANVGYNFAEQLEVLDSGGNRISRQDVKPAPMLLVSFGYRF
jgi:hypothetical protein